MTVRLSLVKWTGDRAGDETQDALGEYAEGDTVVLEDDSEDASADALDGEEASSGGVPAGKCDPRAA